MCDLKVTVEKIELGLNETLIVKTPDRLPEDEVVRMRDTIGTVLPPGTRFLVLAGDIELKKIVVKEK